MNENHPPEVSAFFSDPSDDLLICEYLDIKDDAEITRLAAIMAPQWKTFDPAALVDAAMELQKHTKAGLIRRREALVATMNYSTLLNLQIRLGRSPSMIVNEDDDELHDPIVGPVLQRLLSTTAGIFHRANDLDKARVATGSAAHLVNADARKDIARPTLPCDLEAVLRYGANAPRVPWPILERAFMDCLAFSNQAIQDEHEEDFQRKCNEDYSRALTELENIDSNEPHRRKLRAAIDQCRTALADLQKAKRFREDFIPGQKIPADMCEAAKLSYTQNFQRSGCVKSEESLALLAEKFHLFWEKHGDAYLKLSAAAEQARKSKAEAAPKGPAMRERDLWLERTKMFIHLSDEKLLSVSDREWIENFAARHCELSSKRAQLKVREFFGTLSRYTDRDFDGPEIMGKLHVKGIKVLPEDGVRECLTLMKSASGKKTEKTRKKY